MPIKHVSFDAWNTLIESNSEFATRRTDLIASRCDVPAKVTKAAYSALKAVADHRAEQRGLQISQKDLYDRLFAMMGVVLDRWQIERLQADIAVVFDLYPPTMRDDVFRVLEELVSRGISISVTSNTNFISGTVLEDVLFGDAAMLSRTSVIFDFTVYSDLVGHAKPSSKIFQHVINLSGRQPAEILHVGDNAICDGNASRVGFKTCIVDGPHQLHKLLEML